MTVVNILDNYYFEYKSTVIIYLEREYNRMEAHLKGDKLKEKLRDFYCIECSVNPLQRLRLSASGSALLEVMLWYHQPLD